MHYDIEILFFDVADNLFQIFDKETECSSRHTAEQWSK